MIGVLARRRAGAHRAAAESLAVRFAANDDRISYVGTMPDPAAGITITGWVRLAADRNTFATFFRLFGSSTTITCSTGETGTAGPNYFTGGGSVEIATDLTLNTWYPIATTRLGTTGTLYRGGADGIGATTVLSGTVGGDATPTSITLGGRAAGDASDPLDGLEAYFRVWSTQLDQAAIEAEWASRPPVITANLHADWRLQGASDLADHSGAGRHLGAGANAVTTEAGPPI